MAISSYTARYLLTALADNSAGQEVITTLNDAVQGSNFVNTNITTVGAGTLTAAGLVGGVITRSGSTAAYTDTTDTAANIISALGATAPVGVSWEVIIKNTVAFTQTLSAGSGVTLSGVTVIPGLSSCRFLLTYSAAGAVTMVGLNTGYYPSLPPIQVVSSAYSGSTAAAGDMTGSNICVCMNSANNPGTLTTRTAAQVIADIPNAQVGQTWLLMLVNAQGTGALTLAAGDANLTITGTATVGTNAWRMFVCTVATASTVTFRTVGTGTYS